MRLILLCSLAFGVFVSLAFIPSPGNKTIHFPAVEDSLTIRKAHYKSIAEDSVHIIIQIMDDSIRRRFSDTSRPFFKLETTAGFEIAFGNKDSNRIIPARASLIYAVDDTARPRMSNGTLILLRVPEQETAVEGIAINENQGASIKTDSGLIHLYSLPKWEEKILNRKVSATGRMVVQPAGTNVIMANGTDAGVAKILVNAIWILK